MDDTTGRSLPAEFTVEPYTANCRTIYDRAEHVLIGVSPGNGYFSQERLTRLLRWADGIFARVDPIVPDSALVHTFTALGATPRQAHLQAQRATRRYCRRIARAWQASGVPAERHHVRTLSEFADHPRYIELWARCEEMIAHDPAVREVFHRAAEAVLTAQSKPTPDADRTAPGTPTSAQIEEAMRYLVAEIPMATDTPGILGVPSSVHAYHRMLPIVPVAYEKLFASPRQAFAVIRPHEGGEPSAVRRESSGHTRGAHVRPEEERVTPRPGERPTSRPEDRQVSRPEDRRVSRPGEQPMPHRLDEPLAFPFDDWGHHLSPRYTQLRTARAPLHPVITVTGDRVWLATRYDVVRRLLADPRLSLTAALEPGAPRQEPMTLRAEGGSGNALGKLQDAGLHHLVADSLGLRAVRRHGTWTRQRAQAVVAEVVATGPPVDLYPALAVRLPFALACRVLLGPLDASAQAQLDAWCDTILTWRNPGPQKQTAAINAVHRFFVDQMPSLVDAPGDHLVKRVAQADHDGCLGADDLAELASLMLIAGYRTSSSFLGNALVTLARHPQALAALRTEPTLIPTAVEELLRHTPMATGGAKRVATADVEIDGMTVTAGECVLMALESADHDPAAFPDPDRFDPSRTGRPHLGFSHGTHHCPGNRLARMQLEAIVRALTATGLHLRLAVPADELPWRADVAFRIPGAVWVTW